MPSPTMPLLPPSWNGHVVVLMVFQKPEQVAWLVDWLTGQGAFVVVHIDAKHEARFAALRDQWAQRPLVHVLDGNVVVNWAGFSQVRAELLGIEWARQALPGYRVLHILSGECLPLVDLKTIDQALQALDEGQDLIECRLRPGYEWRINRFSPFGEHPKNRTHWYNLAFKKVRDWQRRFPPRRNVPMDEIYFGSQWWTLRASSLERMLAGLDLEAFCRRFRWTRCADEHFFQILYHRAGLAAVGNRRFDVFEGGSASPKYLALDELRQAAAQGQLFARKVTLDVAQQYWSGHT